MCVRMYVYVYICIKLHPVLCIVFQVFKVLLIKTYEIPLPVLLRLVVLHTQTQVGIQCLKEVS